MTGSEKTSRTRPSRAGMRPATRSPFDFAMFMLLPMAIVAVSGYPLSELAMALAVGVALMRPSLASPPLPLWFTSLLALLVTCMTVVALLQGLTPVRRIVHLLLYCLLAVVMARGRFATQSVASGLAAGLVIAGLAGPLGVGSDYGGRLTGLLGDPNQAGFYLLALGAVSAAYQPKERRRTVFIVVVGLFVILTLSRTTFLAAGLVGVWVLAGRRLGPLANVSLIAGLLYIVSLISELLRLAGPFASRGGSDALRDRIVAAEKVKIDSGPWYGNGPGTSTVDINGDPFFFHSSYLALRNEGGWLAVALIVTLGLLVLLSLARLPSDRRNLWLEGGVIAIATCAVNLGEVLLELPTAIVLGAATHYLLTMQSSGHETSESPESPSAEP